MDTNIYYDIEGHGLLVTSNFAEEKKWMDLGVNPKIEYRKIEISEVDNYKVVDVAFTKVEDDYFQKMKEVFSKLKLEAVAFNDSTVDLSEVIIDVQHLLIGERSKVNISANNFKNLEEVTFLSIKSFKGKILDQFDTVKKAVLWDSTKTSSFPEMFPNVIELTVNKGGLTELDLRNNTNLEKLDVHYCTKLEKILLPNPHKLNDVFIENCKNLDISNLPSIARVWPQRKANAEKKSSDVILESTGNKHLDSLILDLKKNMEDYMHENDPSYTQNDVDLCIATLSDYVIKVFATGSKGEGMEVVKSTVLKLNELNEKCDYSLIETNEREQIAEIIILAGHEKGYNAVDEDVTEEWREW
ncbi:hypothetical protein [Chryseobacterium sp.]|uniref:hypothetical protein n=1 Tax=Chryseobacterium sp. TaxID=1871047 RepID=UPI0031E3BFF2